MNPESVRLWFTLAVSGLTLLILVGTTSIAVYKFIQKEIRESLAKHFAHEHVLAGGITVKDRLVECRRVCPVVGLGPPPPVAPTASAVTPPPPPAPGGRYAVVPGRGRP